MHISEWAYNNLWSCHTLGVHSLFPNQLERHFSWVLDIKCSNQLFSSSHYPLLDGLEMLTLQIPETEGIDTVLGTCSRSVITALIWFILDTFCTHDSCAVTNTEPPKPCVSGLTVVGSLKKPALCPGFSFILIIWLKSTQLFCECFLQT